MPRNRLARRARPRLARATDRTIAPGSRKAWCLTGLTAVLLSVTSLVAGCGSDSSSPGVAQLSKSTLSSTTSRTARPSSEGGSLRTQMIAFSQCIRSHGVTDFPDPDSQGVVAVTPAQVNALKDSPVFKTAVAACKSDLPSGSAVLNSSGQNELAQVRPMHALARSAELPRPREPRQARRDRPNEPSVSTRDAILQITAAPITKRLRRLAELKPRTPPRHTRERVRRHSLCIGHPFPLRQPIRTAVR
jgi:hypothetical protein